MSWSSWSHDDEMLIDDYLPRWEVRERHETLVEADAEMVYRAVRQMDLVRSIPIAVLFALRGAPGLLTGKTKFSRCLTLDTFQDAGFVILEEDPGAEIVLGVIGKFWQPDGGLRRVDADRFTDFDEPGFAKAVMNLYVEGIGPARSRLSTETRVRCIDEGARRRFRLYWGVVGPFSGLIRVLMLRAVKRQAEAGVRQIV